MLQGKSLAPGSVAARLAAGALLAMAAAFIPLAQYTCAMLLWSDSPINIQPHPDDSGPIPAALVWNPRTYRVLTAIGGFPLAGALGLYIAIAAGGAYTILRIINPSFRLTTGVDWNRWLLFKTYMHTAPLIKVTVTIVPVLVAVFFLAYGVASALPGGPAATVLTAMLVGASVWLALSRNGFVGDCESGNYLLPSPSEMISLCLRGSTFGAVIWLLIYAVMEVEPAALLRMGRALGGLGEAGWRPLAALWLGTAGLAGASAVLTALGLGTPGLDRTRRAGYGLAGVVLALVLGVGTQRGMPAYAASRLDYSWRTGQAIVPRWWSALPNSEALRVWVAVPVGGSWRVRDVSSVGISEAALSDATLHQIREHLSHRRFRSALSNSAYMALYEAACRDFDPRGRMQVAREALARLGDASFLRLFLAELWTQAGSPEARNALDVLRNPATVVYLTDDAHLPSGDLCARNGSIPDALGWYRKAGLPASRAEERAARLTPFLDTAVSGRVRGLPPSWRLRVGLVPEAAELTLLMRADKPTELSPMMLREIVRAAATDPTGRFRLSGMPEGRYLPVLWISAPANSRRVYLHVAGAASAVHVNAARPAWDLGVLSVSASEPD